ncbi:MAG: aldehyde dehydrogenase [Deltaproteobacteria bacterium]|nr:MAG: aldehyde dehydrogenase [Deltaproteobacteria bacterium]
MTAAGANGRVPGRLPSGIFSAAMIPDAPVLVGVDPATGRPHPPLPCASPEDVAAAVADARKARGRWREAGVEGRAAVLRRGIEKLADPAVAESLAERITSEMGKPIAKARAEIATVLARFEPYVERAKAASAPTRAREGGIEVEVTYRPLGVAAVIGPWNYPVATPANLLLSSLLMGNTVVFKPSEVTPRTGLALAEILADALPRGVLSCVVGGGDVGRTLVEGGVDLVAFTGSVRTGQAIMKAAAEHMTRLVLELGGKDPMIVLPGADLDRAVAFAVQQGFANSGQVCVAVERILVHREVQGAFTERLVAGVENLTVGPPGDPDTDLGPLATAAQRDHVQALVEDAILRGARARTPVRFFGPGFFAAPVVLDDVTPEMRILHEETFGPVVTVESFDEVDDAVERANATPYGLGASVWGPDDQASAVAERIEAGMVGVNRGISAAAGAPWVGWKKSGYGYARSVEGMRQFAVPQSIARNVASGG